MAITLVYSTQFSWLQDVLLISNLIWQRCWCSVPTVVVFPFAIFIKTAPTQAWHTNSNVLSATLVKLLISYSKKSSTSSSQQMFTRLLLTTDWFTPICIFSSLIFPLSSLPLRPNSRSITDITVKSEFIWYDSIDPGT